MASNCFNMFSISLLSFMILIGANCNYVINAENYNYKPTWDSLDSRPLPGWYDEAKIGIFIHWGVFSVPSFGSEWFWSNWKGNSLSYVSFMKRNYPPQFTYQEFAKDFTAQLWDPKEWSELFKRSGAKYVVLTSKHHEGYTLWPSKYSYSWNSADVGPHRDLIADLSHEVRKSGLRFGLYHSLYEWFNPMYLDDKKNNYSKANFVHNKMIPEMIELVENYKPDVLWSDGDWEASDGYFQSKEFLVWLFNDSPVKNNIVVNDRWGKDIPCKHGDFYTCQDRFNPGVLQTHKWENAMTIDKKSWGFRRNAQLSDYLTMHELITTLIETVSCGGNILINVGPTKDGIITPIFQERLEALGKWLNVNGEAIYGSKPWKVQNDTISLTWYTSKNKDVFATTLLWPSKNVLQLGSALDLFKSVDSVHLLGYQEKLKWRIVNKTVNIDFPDKSQVVTNWAWIIKISTK